MANQFVFAKEILVLQRSERNAIEFGVDVLTLAEQNCALCVGMHRERVRLVRQAVELGSLPTAHISQRDRQRRLVVVGQWHLTQRVDRVLHVRLRH